MPIELKCPECAASLTIPDGSAGRQTRCPRCSAVFAAPDGSASNQSEPDRTGAPSTRPDGPAMVDVSNPYAPTFSSSPIQSPGSSDWAPRQITYDEVFSKTWTIFKDQWLMICVAIVIVGAINVGFSFIQSIGTQILAATDVEPVVVFAFQATFSLVGWVVQIWLTIGQTMVMLDIARGREVNLAKIFGGGPLLINSVLAMIMYWFALAGTVIALVGVPALVGGLAMQNPEGALFGACVGVAICFLPFAMVLFGFSQFQVLIVDRGLGPVESLRTSYEITNGNKLTLWVIGILLMVLGVLASIAGLLVFCVGIVPAIIGVAGFGALLLAVTYLCMTGQQVAIERTFVSPAPMAEH